MTFAALGILAAIAIALGAYRHIYTLGTCAAMVYTPAGEKTASPMAPVADADGLTICEGTPWAYTMMNWA